MNFSYDHERFVAKNKSLASAEEGKRGDNLRERGDSFSKSRQEGSCFNCKMKQTCTEFKAKRSGRSTGVVSFGGDQKFLCDRYVPAPTQAKSMSDKQIRALLKNVKNGY